MASPTSEVKAIYEHEESTLSPPQDDRSSEANQAFAPTAGKESVQEPPREKKSKAERRLVLKQDLCILPLLALGDLFGYLVG